MKKVFLLLVVSLFLGSCGLAKTMNQRKQIKQKYQTHQKKQKK